MPLSNFHPAVAAWFAARFEAPTDAQVRAWPSIQAGRSTLVAAPTGSGKTLAAFLAILDDLVRRGLEGSLDESVQVVYVSPLKALTNDIQINLKEPLAGIEAALEAAGLPRVPIRALVRTGDTPAADRAAMRRRPPHILVTTPESLYILLTSPSGRAMFAQTRTVIVDEIHSVIESKRGSHLALTLERLEAVAGRPLVRIGLSATQRPIATAARFLTGTGGLPDGAPACTIVDAGHVRALDMAIEVPESPLEAVMSLDVWKEVYDRVAALILEHRTTLVFVNARRMAERVAHQLSERVGAGRIATHHGSLARERRLEAEQRLKSGDLRAIVATSSLELGIDIGAVDLVVQLGATRSIAAFLQRTGRSGHFVGGRPRGRLFPLTRDELVDAAALLDAVRRGELDTLEMPQAPLDILAQQIVAETATADWKDDDLFALARRAWPYRNLARSDFDAVVGMLAEGFTTRRGRRSAWLHRDVVNARLRGRRGARLAAITSGGAIPDTADYDVVMEPQDIKVGSVNEDFAIEAMAGDIFQLGNTSWRIVRVEPGKVRVEDARGQPPTMPFWLGEAPARTAELSAAMSRLREEIDRRLAEGDGAALDWLVREVGVARGAAEQIVAYLGAARAALGVMPTQETLVVERFFDESGGMQLVLHAPFGGRVNRAWALALRKRFCVRFNFELQGAATENAVLLSLGPTHSFPLDDVFRYLRPASVRQVLTEALLAAPMFEARWRWNAGRALAVLRWRSGRKVPPRLQRFDADDLLALVFPDQQACPENTGGVKRVPDHPLVAQTIRDCLEEAMDIDRLTGILTAVEQGRKTLVARDLREPSPLTQEALTARPYAFIDDAPLEERRTQAVHSRRWLDPAAASDLGALDPAAIERVRAEAWPEAGSADELHDALMLHGYLGESEIAAGPGWRPMLEDLVAARRAAVVDAGAREPLWVAAERLPQIRAVFPSAPWSPPIPVPAAIDRLWDRGEALVEIVRGRLEALGPVTAAGLAASSGLPAEEIEAALLRLESEGFVLRGRFTGEADVEWSARRLLARIHRATLDRLRREIEPVSAAEFQRFLFAWQHLAPGTTLEGAAGLAAIVEQMEGFEAPAGAWERTLLPFRLRHYDPSWLDGLCLSGRLAWGRLTPPRSRETGAPAPAPVRATPIALLPRARLDLWRRSAPRDGAAGGMSADARTVHEKLAERGASFFHDLVGGTRLLEMQVEIALAELVARGLVTSDGFAGVRALLVPASKRRPGRGRGRAPFGMEGAGRWSLIGEAGAASPAASGEDAAVAAEVLLRRYGVVFRRLVLRESLLPPWRDVLAALRRMEMRGEVRGGRFVAGVPGEQFALPSAVERLRAVRREGVATGWVAVGAADPLNLAGILTAGARIPPVGSHRLLYLDGVPSAVREKREIRWLVDLDPEARFEARSALTGYARPRPRPLSLSQPA